MNAMQLQFGWADGWPSSEVVDLSVDDSAYTDTDSSMEDAFNHNRSFDSHISRASSSSSTAILLWFSDEDEGDVVARMADEDWDVVESMVGATKVLRTSALVNIIMPNQQKPLTSISRRGGRRGTASRARRLERLSAL